MTESKLKPCPFCGGEAEYDEDFFGRAYIQCSNCEAHLQDKKAYQDCIEAWNKRMVQNELPIQNESKGTMEMSKN